MKITSLREPLLKTLSLSIQVINPRPNLPVLANFLLEARAGFLEITATNLETTIVYKLPVSVEEEGKATVPARLLVEFCQMSSSEKLTLQVDEENAQVVADKSRANLSTISPAEFPTLGVFEEKTSVELPRTDFLGAVSSVAFCASIDEGRPVLTGVLLKSENKKLSLVATDGYRLAKKQLGTDIGLEVLIPARPLQEAVKGFLEEGDETLILSTDKQGNQVKISTKNLSVISRLLEGSYPNFEQIIPTNFVSTLVFNKKELTDGIKLTALLAKDVGNVVRLHSSGKSVSIKATTSQVGQSETQLTVKPEGEAIEAAFNSRFLLDALSAIKGEKVKMSLSGNTSAAIMQGEDEGLLYVVMPVRIQS